MQVGRTNRRAFIARLEAAPRRGRWLRAGSGQQCVIAILRSHGAKSRICVGPFKLKETGFVKDQDVVIEYRWGDSQYDLVRHHDAEEEAPHRLKLAITAVR